MPVLYIRLHHISNISAKCKTRNILCKKRLEYLIKKPQTSKELSNVNDTTCNLFMSQQRTQQYKPRGRHRFTLQDKIFALSLFRTWIIVLSKKWRNRGFCRFLWGRPSYSFRRHAFGVPSWGRYPSLHRKWKMPVCFASFVEVASTNAGTFDLVKILKEVVRSFGNQEKADWILYVQYRIHCYHWLVTVLKDSKPTTLFKKYFKWISEYSWN